MAVVDPEKIKRAFSLLDTTARFTPMYCRHKLVEKFGPLFLPDPDDDSAKAWKRRSWLSAYQTDKSIDPTIYRNMTPFTGMLRCVISWDHLNTVCLMTDTDLFDDLSLSDTVIADWSGGRKAPEVGLQAALNERFRQSLGPRINLFRLPDDRWCVLNGYLSRAKIPLSDKNTFYDEHWLGGDQRLRLTVKSSSFPLIRYSRRIRRAYIIGSEEWIYRVNIGSLKRFRALSLKWATKRWQLFKELHELNEWTDTLSAVFAKQKNRNQEVRSEIQNGSSTHAPL